MSYGLKWLAAKLNKGCEGFFFEKAFGLIDSLVGVAILGFALIGIFMVFRQSTVSSSANTLRNQAMYIAQQTIEEFKKNDGLDKDSNQVSWSVESPKRVDGVDYTIQTRPLDAEAITGASDINTYLKPIEVKVSWVEPHSAVQSAVQLIGYYYLKP